MSPAADRARSTKSSIATSLSSSISARLAIPSVKKSVVSIIVEETKSAASISPALSRLLRVAAVRSTRSEISTRVVERKSLTWSRPASTISCREAIPVLMISSMLSCSSRMSPRSSKPVSNSSSRRLAAVSMPLASRPFRSTSSCTLAWLVRSMARSATLVAARLISRMKPRLETSEPGVTIPASASSRRG